MKQKLAALRTDNKSISLREARLAVDVRRGIVARENESELLLKARLAVPKPAHRSVRANGTVLALSRSVIPSSRAARAEQGYTGLASRV